jgi:hypothetical protein
MARTPTFNILTAYESLERALRVKELLDRLASDLRSTCKINCEFWNFELLEHPPFRAQAAAEASEANMVIIAARGDTDLEDGVKSWLEAWLPRRQSEHTALVALLDEEGRRSGEPPRPCAYLQKIAERSNMDFFCQAGGWQPDQLQYVVESVHRETEVPFRVTIPEASSRNEAFYGWGIND